MSRMTIDERVHEAVREVAEAFTVPMNQVETIAEELERRALEQAFGKDPRVPIAEELARRLRQGVESGLDKIKGGEGEGDTERLVIDFPGDGARRAQG